MSFEAKCKNLETIVKKLETPEMGIDEGVKLFADGVKLSKECYDILNNNKGEIVEIKKQLETITEKPFNA